MKHVNLFRVMRFAILSIVFITASFLAKATDYYWVGGSGLWSDLTHWATASGGSTHPSIVPTPIDNVVFDGNSFTSSGGTVTINFQAFCNNFTVTTGVGANVTFQFNAGVIASGGINATPSRKITWNQASQLQATTGITFDKIVFNMNSGTVTDSGSLVLLDSSVFNFNANNTIYVGGTLAAGSINVAATATYNQMNGGTLTVNAPITVPSGATFNCNASKNLNRGGFEMQAGSTGNIYNQWIIMDGGFKLDAAATVTNSASNTIYLRSTKTDTCYIKCGGKNIGRVQIDGTNYNSQYRLLDSFTALNDGIYVYENKFYSDGHPINVYQFYCWSGDFLTVDLTGTDTVRVVSQFRLYPSANTTFNIGTATIKWDGTDYEYLYGGGKKFQDLVFNARNTGGTYIMFQYGDTARDVYINAYGTESLNMYDNNVFRNFTFNHLSSTASSAGMSQLYMNSINRITGQFTYNASSPNMRPVWYFANSNTIGTLNFNSHISEWLIGAGSTQTITDLKPLLGSCSNTILIHSNSAGGQAIISQSSGLDTCDWVLLQDIRGTGGATYKATNAIDLGNNTGWSITPISAKTYYWIAGSGNWSSSSHWSLSSGGSAGCAIPTRIDTVIFDANSFSASGQFCTIDIAAECKQMTWNHNQPGSGINGGQNLSIYGSLKLDSNMNYSYGGTLYFQSNTSGNTIQTSGKTLTSTVQVVCQNSGTGVYTLVDKLKTNAWFYVFGGKFVSGGNDVDVYSYYSTAGSSDFTGTSLIRVQNYWLIWYGVGLTLPSTTKILFDGTDQHRFYSYTGPDINHRTVYGNVEFNNTHTGGQQVYMEGQYCNFTKMKVTYAGTYQVYNTINYSKWDSLTVNYTNPNFILDGYIDFYGQQDTINNFIAKSTGDIHPRLRMPYMFRINNLYAQNMWQWILWNQYTTKSFGNISISGSCKQKTIFANNDNPGTQTAIVCNTSASADNCVLKDINISGGGSYTSTNSVDGGNVTGWGITSSSNNYYWVGGTGNWSNTSHWSTSSGGTAAGCLPSPGDNVFFDVNSFSAANQTVTVDVPATFKNMVWSGVNNPRLQPNNQMECFGSLSIASNVTWINNGYWFYFQSRNTGNTVKTGNIKLPYVQFYAENTKLGGWTLQDSLSVYNDLYFRAGSFSSGGYTVSANQIINDYNYNNISLDFTNTSRINVNAQWQMQPAIKLVMDTTNLNFVYNGNNFTFTGGNHKYRNLSFTSPSGSAPTITMNNNDTINNITATSGGWPTFNINNNSIVNDANFLFTNNSSNIPAINISGTNTFNTFNVNSTGNGGPYITLSAGNTFSSLIASGLGTRLYLGAGQTQTVNGLLALGNGSFPVIVQSTTSGTQAKIYKPSGLVCLDYVLLKDIKGDGLASGSGIATQYFAGASSVNLGNNTNWIFSSCDAYYWVGDAGNWSDYAHHWATTSGGTTFHSAAPGPNDNVFFDANSFTLSGQTVTVDVSNASCKSMRWASAVFNPTFTGSGDMNIHGDLELINGMSQNYSGNWHFNAIDTGHTINAANKTLANVYFDSIGKWTLQNPLNVSGDINFNNGTLVTAGKNITTKNFNSSSSFSTRSLQLGSSTVTINGGSWNPSTLTNAALGEGTSTIVITGNSSASFLGNGLTYNNVTFTASPALSATMTGTNTMNTLTISQGMNLGVAAASTQTMSSLVANGTCALPISLHSTTTGTQAIFTKSSGTTNTSFLKIRDMKAQGGATYNAAYSADSGNNTGWNFTSTPTVIDALVSTTHASCITNNNGGASVDSVIGGTKPYIYLWSNSLTTKSISSLIPGNYSVTVTDSIGCNVTRSVAVTNFASYLVASPFTASATNVCLGTGINFTAGSVTDSFGNAATPKSYLWNFGDFTSSTTQNPTKNYSSNGNYTVSLSYVDTNGCPAITTGAVKVSAVAQSVTSTNVLCNGAGNGTITIAASNGVPPYQYSINGGTTYVSSGSFTGLTPGTYQVKTKDSIGCSTSTQTINITQPSSALSFSKAKTDVTCASATNGSITISASGGTTPYSYSINNGILYVSTNSFANLASGTYNVIVRDANACTAAMQQVTIGVHDTTKPTITCPSNISVSASGCTQAVTVPAPVAGDECSLVSVTNNFNGTSDASDTYTAGVTNVIWTATDGGGNTATCTMTVTVSGPVITVSGNANTINGGDTGTSATNNTNFGNVAIGANLTRSFNIKNSGTSNFIISSISLSGSSDFTKTYGSFPDTIQPGQTHTLNVTLTPSSLGAIRGTVTITSSACNNGSFTYAIAGTGICATPTAYSVTGGGAYCSGGNGVAIGLSNSQTGVNYQLKQGATDIGSAVAGTTGSAISFGNQTGVGNYTIVATNTLGGCTATMSGSATVSINALPTVFNITGGGNYCSGGTGVAVGLSGSQSGVNYQLYNSAGAVGSSLAGTGGSLNFGNKTVNSTYFVVATNASTSCSDTMSGTAVVSTYAHAAAYTVTGTGSYCAGGTGVEVGLSSSDAGFSYQLKYGTVAVGSALSGTGAALSFGNKTLDTTYFVVATRTTGGCLDTMSGTAKVTINPLPTRTISGPSSVCFGSSAVLKATVSNTRTYYIPFANLLNVPSSCGANSYYNSCNPSLQPGFSWRDSGTTTPTNVQVQFNVGVECHSGFTHTTTLNSVSGPSFAQTPQWCNCSGSYPSGGTIVTVNYSSPTSYNVGGTNTFLIGSLNTCMGFYPSSDLSNFYAVVTVSYPSTASSGVTYNWTPGGATADSIIVSPSSTTTYKLVTTSSAGCKDSTTKTVTVNPLPTVYNMTGGGSYCPSGAGVTVGLSNSQSGINYQLMRGTTSIATLSGTGGSLNFGNQTTTGNYYVIATNASTGCMDTMSGVAAVSLYNLSTVYNVTGGGSYCSGGTGVTVGLSSSDTGFSYQLMRGSSTVGSAVAGTGSAISFGNQTTAGTYTVVATRVIGGCTNNMSGSATVGINPLPVPVISGPAAICAGDSAVLKVTAQTTRTYNIASANLISFFGNCGNGGFEYWTGSPGFMWNDSGTATPTNIQVQFSVGVECNSGSNHTTSLNSVSAPSFTQTPNFCDCSVPSSPQIVTLNFTPSSYHVGAKDTFLITNLVTDFGLFPVSSLGGYYAKVTVTYGSGASGTTYVWSPGGSTADSIKVSPASTTTYKLVATTSLGCTDSTTKVLTVNPLPTVYTVTGGGINCAGASGVAVGLSGSETGVNYQLMLGSSTMGSPVAGTGSAISFGNKTSYGNYTVLATNATTHCTNNMSGSVAVIQDTAKPNVITQNITVYLNTSGVISITPAQIDNGSTDNCTIASRTLDITTFNCSNEGNNTVTLTVTDLVGNSQTGTAIVTVVDTVKPIVYTNNMTVYLNASGSASVTAAQIDNSSTDNCTISSRTLDVSSFTCTNEGSNTVTLTVTDNSGNSQTGTAVVTVVDTNKPIVHTNNITAYLDATGAVTITPAQIDNGSTDNCAIASRTLDITSFSCANEGANTVTLTVTDNSGNSQTGTAVVTVVDTIRPTVNTNNITVYLDATGATSITAAQIDNGSTDNCTVSSKTIDVSNFTCENKGANTVTLTVTDNSGNIQTGTAIVTVVDTTKPTVRKQNITVYLNATGLASITAADIDNGSTDNCTIASKTLSKTSFSCVDEGANTVTLTVTDNSGNSKSCNATVTVVDTIRPNVMTQNITAYLDASGNITITPSNIDNGSTDNCTIVSRIIDKTSFNCGNEGANTVTLTITDNSGNVQTGTATVTVVDTVKPTVRKQNITVYLDASGFVNITAADIDNGSTDNCTIVSRTLDRTSFNCSNEGANTVILTVTDNSGNSRSCTATVTVMDTTKPVVVTRNITAYLNATGSIAITPADINNGSTDNCAISSLTLSKTSFNCSNEGANTVTLTVVDNSSNTASATAVVTVVDTTMPTVITKTATVYLDATGNGSITVTNIDNGSTDNCTIISKVLSKTSFNCSDKGANTVSLTVTDNSGNVNVNIATVNVIDGIAPTITCPSNKTVACNTDPSNTGRATATDNCDASPAITYTDASTYSTNENDSSHYSYVITRTWKATDASGNNSTCAQTITVHAIRAYASITQIPCHDDDDGAIELTVYGGVGSLTYHWNNGKTTKNIYDLDSGNYVVTITDATGCAFTNNWVLTPPTRIYLSGTVTDATCNGSSTGSITSIVSGGTPAYTYHWSTGQTTANLTNIPDGHYRLTVTDIHGCTKSKDFDVDEPSAINASASVSNVSCNGGSNGAINLSVSGGTSPYSYSWSNGAHTQDISGLSAGSYTVAVTDAKGCTKSATYTVTQPTALSLSALATAVSCNGGNNGSVNLTVTGGTSSYSYLWSNGAHSQDISGLTAGSFSVTVTDHNGCTVTGSYTVAQPTAITITGNVTNVSCNDGDNGGINITATGGTGSYTYSWSDGGTCSSTGGAHTHHSCSSWWGSWCGAHSGGSSSSHSEDISNIEAGVYTVTVTDANGCTKTATFTVSEPSAITASAVVTHISCYGGSSGAINLTVSGGAGSYSYTWSNGAHTQDVSGLTAGTYTVTITDANGCTKTASYTVTQPSSAIHDDGSRQTNVSCYGGNNGFIDYDIAGGSPGYTYSWSNGATTDDLSGISAGTYSVIATDSKGCTRRDTFIITQPNVISITGAVTNATCSGGSSGAVNITVTGGSGSYSYTWSNGAHTQDISGLSAGTYAVTVRDANGCTKTTNFTVTSPSAISAAINVNPVYAVSPGGDAYTLYIGYGPKSDSLIASASGGTGTLTYSWSPSSTLSSSTAARVKASPTASTTYTVTVTDAAGCTVTKTRTIFVVDVRCGGNNSHKVIVCQVNNGHTHEICIDSSAVAAHLASGDNLGPCDNSGARVVKGSEEEPLNIKVFPNPNSGKFSVVVPSVPGSVQIEMIDMTGKVIDAKTIQDGTISQQVDFNFNDIVRGLYFIKVIANDKAYIEKVIIQ